jgi:hemerythrin-like domain-containing protein
VQKRRAAAMPGDVMSVLMLLEAEHERLEKLLQVIEREAVALERQQECDRPLLALAIEYWRTYPDQCHHPKEDLVLTQMLRRGVPGSDELHRRFTAGHEALGALSASVADALEPSNSPASTSEIAALLRRFVDENRQHMALEEVQVFAVAHRCLAEDDWEDIDFELLDRNDPVFNRPLEQRYHVLLDEILALDSTREAQLRRSRMREFLARGNPEGLEDISSIQDFNDAAGNALFGREYRLVATPAGGLALQRNASTVLQIPRCGEKQAAWCACFYLLGVESRPQTRRHALHGARSMDGRQGGLANTADG